MQKNIYGKMENNWDIIIITVNNYKQKEFAKKEILKTLMWKEFLE